MRYIADCLTFVRILSALLVTLAALLVLFAVAPSMSYAVALIVVALAFLTDALDGMAARRWPYSPQEQARLFYRKDAHLFDNAGDSLLYIATALVLATHNSLWLWLLAGAMAVSICLVVTIELLQRHGSVWAERIDVVFGWLFGATMLLMLAYLASIAYPGLWIWLVGGGAVVTLVVLRFKWDRLTTRPERRVAAK